MKVYRSVSELHFVQKNVLTVGTYDGLHLGHRKVLTELKKIAHHLGLPTAVMTFSPHPQNILAKSAPLNLLTTNQEKISLFEKLEIDHLIVYPFTKDFAQLSEQDYMDQILLKQLNMQHMVIGYDHHFGKNRTGDFSTLLRYSKTHHFGLDQISVHLINEIEVSSTKIRYALLQGDLLTAKQYLGRNYSLEGLVVQGKKMGRDLGFPTANLRIDSAKLLPKNGVYAVKVHLPDHQIYQGMMNLGYAPTLHLDGDQKIEVHLFDFKDELYGKILKIELISYWREEQTFASIDALISQLYQDQDAIKTLLKQD